MYKSKSWIENQKVFEEMEEIEEELKIHQNEKVDQEAKAIAYIESNLANFYKYTRKFSGTTTILVRQKKIINYMIKIVIKLKTSMNQRRMNK